MAVASATSTPGGVLAVAPPAPSATPLPAGPSQPAGGPSSEHVEIASSTERSPAPFVLFGALLFALAAAAGHVLRSDPTLLRRLVPGGGSASGTAPTLRQTAYATAGGPPPVGDAVTTLTGSEPHTFTGTEPHTLNGHTLTGQTLTDFVDPNSVAPTLNGAAQTSAGGLGGQDGGLGRLGEVSGGFDSLGKSSLASPDMGGFGGAESLHEAPQTNLPETTSEAPQDVDTSQTAARPTDYQLRPITEADIAPEIAHGGGLGGGQGSDPLARGLGPFGSELASGQGGFGSDAGSAAGQISGGQGGLGGAQGSDLLARGTGVPADALAHAPSGSIAPVDSGLGGVHGSGAGTSGDGNSLLGRGLTPGGLDLAGLPTNGAPGDLGVQGGLGGHQGAGDPLARGVTPGSGGPLDSVARTVVTPDAALSDAGPVWLAAGALARAGSLDWDTEDPQDERPTRVREPLSMTYPCPSCQRQLPFGPRFCGYCGEPLDKTIA